MLIMLDEDTAVDPREVKAIWPAAGLKGKCTVTMRDGTRFLANSSVGALTAKVNKTFVGRLEAEDGSVTPQETPFSVKIKNQRDI